MLIVPEQKPIIVIMEAILLPLILLFATPLGNILIGKIESFYFVQEEQGDGSISFFLAIALKITEFILRLRDYYEFGHQIIYSLVFTIVIGLFIINMISCYQYAGIIIDNQEDMSTNYTSSTSREPTPR